MHVSFGLGGRRRLLLVQQRERLHLLPDRAFVAPQFFEPAGPRRQAKHLYARAKALQIRTPTALRHQPTAFAKNSKNTLEQLLVVKYPVKGCGTENYVNTFCKRKPSEVRACEMHLAACLRSRMR